MNRGERIEEYYHNGTRELAEWVVDLEDEVKKLKEDNKGLAKAWMDLARKKKELDPSRLESALRMYIAELSHDLHTRTQNCAGCGQDHYPEEVDFFLRCWETAGES